MIRELLIGTAVIGGGGYYVASTYSGAEVVRTVNATPHDTWRGFDLVFNQTAAAQFMYPDESGIYGYSPSGMRNSALDEARKVRPMVVSTDSKEIDFRLNQGGEQLVRVHIRFEPLAGGAQTRLRVDTEVNRARLPGDSDSSLPRRLIFKQMLTRLTDDMVKGIESGKLVKFAEILAEARRQYDADPRAGERKLRAEEYKRREAQAAASAPMVDPDAAKLNPVGAPVAPASSYPGR
jgi:hypothetical protein